MLQQELVPSKNGKPRRVDYLFEFPSIRRWLGELKEGPGRKINVYIFHRYMLYVKNHSGFKTPEDLIDNALNSTVKQLQQHSEILKDYLETLDTVGDSTRSKHRDVVVSFYSNNGVEAIPWGKFKKKNSGIEIYDKSDDSADFVAMMREVCRRKCSTLQLAILLTTYQSFMDDSTIAYVFNYFGFPQLVKHFGTAEWRKWDESKVPVRIDLVRPKSDVQGWTCLHRDATAAIKAWLSARYNLTGREIRIYPSPNARHLPRSDPLFIIGRDNHPIPPEYISYVFRRLGKNAGVNVYYGPRPAKTQGASIRYAFRSHEVRDNARSLAHPLKIGEEVEFFISHKMDRHGYNKSPWKDPEYFLEAYDKLAPWLNVLSCDPEKMKLENELKQKGAELEEKENKWFVHSKKLEAEIDTLKRVNRLRAEFDTEEDPVKQHEIGEKLKRLMSE